jgi:hypothetical protein
MISEKAHKIGALMTEILQGLPRVEFMALCKEMYVNFRLTSDIVALSTVTR